MRPNYKQDSLAKDLFIHYIDSKGAEKVITNNQIISESLYFHEAIQQDGNLYFGSCVVPEFSLDISKDCPSLNGKTVYLSVKCRSTDDRYDDQIIGTFKITSDKGKPDGMSRHIEGIGTLSDLLEKNVTSTYKNTTYPISAADFARSCFSDYEFVWYKGIGDTPVSHVAENFLFYDSYSIVKGGFITSYKTIKDKLYGAKVLQDMAELEGAYVKEFDLSLFGGKKTLAIARIGTCVYATKTDVTITDFTTTNMTIRQGTFDKAEYKHNPVTAVILYVPTGSWLSGKSGIYNPYNITNNMFADGLKTIQPDTKSILDNMEYSDYTPFSLETHGDPFCLGSEVYFPSNESNPSGMPIVVEHDSYVLENTVNGIQSMRSVISAEGTELYETSLSDSNYMASADDVANAVSGEADARINAISNLSNVYQPKGAYVTEEVLENYSAFISPYDAEMLGYVVPTQMPVQNYLVGRVFHQRVARVDMGTLNWGVTDTNRFYTTSLNTVIKKVGDNAVANIWVEGYTPDTANNVINNKANKHTSVGSTGTFSIRDTSYTSSQTLKADLSGKYLYYELATEVTKNIDGNEFKNIMSVANYYSGRPTTLALPIMGDGALRHFKATSSLTDTTATRPYSDGHVIHAAWDNTSGYDSELWLRCGIGANATQPKMQVRSQAGSATWGKWYTMLDEGNIGSYAIIPSHSSSQTIERTGTGNANVPLVIKSGGTATSSFIGYAMPSGTVVGYMGINSNGLPTYYRDKTYRIPYMEGTTFAEAVVQNSTSTEEKMWLGAYGGTNRVGLGAGKSGSYGILDVTNDAWVISGSGGDLNSWAVRCKTAKTRMQTGSVTIASGTTTATVNFSETMKGTPRVMLTPRNAVATNAGAYISSVDSAKFVVTKASSGSGTWDWVAIYND